MHAKPWAAPLSYTSGLCAGFTESCHAAWEHKLPLNTFREALKGISVV